MKTEMHLDTSVVAAPEQVYADVGGETVILCLPSGEYFGLDEVGARIWAMIQEPCTVEAICRTLLAEYDGVGVEQCREEVILLLQQLIEAGLIRIAARPDTVLD
jgi:hypothetical protein